MTDAAVEQTPAPDGVVVDSAVTQALQEPADQSEDDLLSEIWDRAQESDAEAGEEPGEPVEDAKATGEADPEPDDDLGDDPVAAPTDLPRALREHWGAIPEEAREAFVTSQRDMAKKLGDAGRLQQGLQPVQDALVRAAQEMPFMADMKPAQVAAEVFELAKISQAMQSHPVETVMQIIDKRGLRQAVAQAMLGRDAPQNTPENEILAQNRKLQHELQTMAERLNGIEQAPVAQMVNEFATGSEHWAEVEPGLPAAIQYVQAAEPGLSAKDTLAKAFTMELQRLGKAPSPAASTAAVNPDPEQTERAMKAKSVNVKSKSSGKPPVKTERELLADIYDKNQRL